MKTLLQNLLWETLNPETDAILRSYIATILPAMEQEFTFIPALGGDYNHHYQTCLKLGDSYGEENATRYASKADQSLLVHVLNALLTCWNLLPFLNQGISETEKYLLCLGITLHDYNKALFGNEKKSPKAWEIESISQVCQQLGTTLDFEIFWSDWRDYLPEITYLAQNTQGKIGANAYPTNYQKFTIDSRRLKNPLCYLLGFGDIAVHMQDPGAIATSTAGDRLREILRFLGIKQQLIYHRLRDSLGILTNGIHNATLYFTQELNWQPLLFFPQGVVYLAPSDAELPSKRKLQSFIWSQISQLLGNKMLSGDIGFKRDGKGLKVAPQTLELFTPAKLINSLPNVVKAKVNNRQNPATPKRLDKLNLSKEEKEFLKTSTDLRSDWIAEFFSLIQKQFLGNQPGYLNWVLETLELQEQLTPEQTQVQAGGVIYGWYHVAAHYIAKHGTYTEEDIQNQLKKWAAALITWAQAQELLPEHQSPTQEVFNQYLESYLEIKGWDSVVPSFTQELDNYNLAKTKAAKQPICSLSSGEFPSEDQKDSVVLFKPQQYSNKNPLGGRKIKRGISKIWSLEMLLRQAQWSIAGGKLEEQNPVFIYIFPAYVYSPQTATAISLLVEQVKLVNLWEVRKHWQKNAMDLNALRSLEWLKTDFNSDSLKQHQYNSQNLPFMAAIHTTTKGNTKTEAWIKPAFLALALPTLLGVKVVATSSFVPLYSSDNDFLESIILDGVAGFWTLLGFPTSLRLPNIEPALSLLLAAYSLHLDTRSKKQGKHPDARWQDFVKTVREIVTDVLNVFSLANQGLRKEKREYPNQEEVKRYWQSAQIFAQGESSMTEKLKLTTRLVQEYRRFYQVKVTESSHAILLPLSKALEVILSVPDNLDNEELIWQGAGQLQAALERQEVYKRPLITDKNLEYSTRQAQELAAIHTFMTTCVEDVFTQMYQGDRALLQENRNRLKAGAEFAYRWLALQEKTSA